MTDLIPNDLSHMSDADFNALCPQGHHAPGPEPLSPAAQAVLDAFFASDWEDEPLHANIAAAFRKLEDILAQDRAEPLPPDLERAVLTERIRLFRRITAIAAELERQ